MKWVKWILAYLFDCVHRHTTWPHCDHHGLDYVCCLDCGRELPYSTRRMSIVTKEQLLEDRAFGWEQSTHVECRVVTVFSREEVRAS